MNVTLMLSDPALEVDGELSRTAMRIVQEALTNSLKHGRATHGQVALAYDGDALTVEVVDNGVGPAALSPAVHRGRRGLRGIQARVSRMCGDFQVGRGPSGGFRVWARLPRLAPSEGRVA
jgi:signal transduction histidine kinase